MDNKFFSFIEANWGDVSAFLKAFVGFVKALVEKVNG